MERQKGHQASRPRTILAWMGLLAEQALNNPKSVIRHAGAVFG